MNYEKIYKKPMRILLPMFLVLFLLILIPSISAQTISISPPSQSRSLYSDDVATFIDVRITGVTDLCGFQFDLSYNTNVLGITSPNNVSEGSFLNNNGNNLTDWTPPKLYSGFVNETACVIIKENDPYEGIDGSGVLATVAFYFLKDNPPGRSYLNLTGIKLSDKDTQPITFTVSNGYVDTEECLGSETRPCTCNGTRVCQNNVWGPCNGTCPGEVCDGMDNDQDGYIDNAPGTAASYTLTQYCSINYTGACAVGNETCTASGWAGCPVPQTEVCNAIDEDCDGDNNECLGDITDNAGGNPDGCVNIFDLTLVSTKFGLVSTDAGWDPRADVVVTNEIDIFDLVTVARDFGSGPSC